VEGKPAYPPGSTDALQAQLLAAERQARGQTELSAAQLDTVRLYARGLPREQIALSLGISETSVRGRLARSMKLLRVDTLQELATLAGRLGLDTETQEPPPGAADELTT
jgi:DNA-binding NarL/FixJ family response regulator